MNTTNKPKTMKAAALYTREYGAAAYQAWLRREADITELAKAGRSSKREICRLREENFRQMKAEGARRAVGRSTCEKQALLAA